MRRNVLTAALLAILVVTLASCGDDDPVEPDGPVPPPPERIATADSCIARFADHYATRDLDAYAALQLTDFLFVGANGSLDSRNEDLAITGKMFGEVAGDSGIVIEDILIEELRPVGDWTDVPANHPQFGGFAGSRFRSYEVDLRFVIPSQNLVLRSVGPVIFITMDVGDADDPDVRLLGILDTTDGPKSVETHSWSDVRGLFR